MNPRGRAGAGKSRYAQITVITAIRRGGSLTRDRALLSEPPSKSTVRATSPPHAL